MEDTTGIADVDVDFGDLDHLERPGRRCVALFDFPDDLLDAGCTSAGQAPRRKRTA